MQIRIKDIQAIAPGLETHQQWCDWAADPVFADTPIKSPKLEFIPMMQRRRLSPFARLCCHTLHQLTSAKDMPIVFVSRFGDLAKTDLLIGNVVDQQPLSPTQFGLSVHNAVAGQYSIFTNNTAPSTTLSAGIDSFHMGMFEAAARLSQIDYDELALVCTDTVTPERYLPYIKEHQVNYSVAVLLSKTQGRTVTLNQSMPMHDTNLEIGLPQALQFMAWYFGKQDAIEINSPQYRWHWQNA